MTKKPSNRRQSTVKIDVQPKTKNQKLMMSAVRNTQVTICTGIAGTGKTFLAAAESLKLLREPENGYNKIVLVKSVTPLSGEEIGYLKGELEAKMAPYMYSFVSNFYKLLDKVEIDALMHGGDIEVLPIAFMRGINLDNCVVIIDEAQNISIDNMKTIMTRIGTNTKMIILGDQKQIDLRNKRLSSLDKIVDKFEGVDHFAVVRFTREDQVRNPLINVIEDAFDEIGQ